MSFAMLEPDGCDALSMRCVGSNRAVFLTAGRILRGLGPLTERARWRDRRLPPGMLSAGERFGVDRRRDSETVHGLAEDREIVRPGGSMDDNLTLLTRVNAKEILAAFKFDRLGRSQPLAECLVSFPARRLSHQILRFDDLVGRHGLAAAGRYIL